MGDNINRDYIKRLSLYYIVKLKLCSNIAYHNLILRAIFRSFLSHQRQTFSHFPLFQRTHNILGAKQKNALAFTFSQKYSLAEKGKNNGNSLSHIFFIDLLWILRVSYFSLTFFFCCIPPLLQLSLILSQFFFQLFWITHTHTHTNTRC